MRLDLQTNTTRPWYLSLRNRALGAYVGQLPGPVAMYSFRPDLIADEMVNYFWRSASHMSRWSRGEAELFAAFVSKKNSCGF